MAAAEVLPKLRVEVERVQHSLHGIAEDARRIDTRSFELEDHQRVRVELLPLVYRAVERAVGVLGEVLTHYDRPAAPGGTEDSGVFACMFDDMVAETTSGSPRQRVADMSFMARWELDRKRAAIAEAAAATAADDWHLIAECCSARRRVIKATSGVERVLAEVESVPSVFGDLYQTEKQRAVATRAAYYAFVTRLRAAQRSTDDVERCLRLAGTGIAQLVGRDIYQELRIEDRRSLRSLQARLFAWLRGDRDRREGQRLHSELLAFGALLMEVNRRAALIEHDRAVLVKLLEAVRQPATDVRAFYRLLQSIRGRAPELDALIEMQAELRPELWCGPAEQVLARLAEPVG